MASKQSNWRFSLLRAARLAWLAVLLTLVVLFVGALARSLSQPQLLCTSFATPACSEAQSAAALARAGLTPVFYNAAVTGLRDVLVPVGFIALGLLIFARQRETWLALAASALLVCYGLAVNTSIMTNGLEGTGWAATANQMTDLAYGVFSASFVTVLYCFPDGRLAPGWAGWLAGMTFGAALLAQAEGLTGQLGVAALLLLLVAGLILQVYRYRRVSTAVERQQTKWVLVGLAGLVVNSGLWFAVTQPALLAGAAGIVRYAVTVPVNVVLVLALPVTLALSILRYRLWDIDLIIRRTLVYSLVSLLLGLAYVGSVIVLQGLLRGLAGESTLAVVASTLLIAALFSPLRRAVQAFIDQRFYRGHYDAARTLAEFSLSVRDQVELDQLTGQLLAVIDQAIRPTHLTLWLPSVVDVPAGGREAESAQRTDIPPA